MADQAVATRLERGSGQGTAEIGLMHPDEAQTGRGGVVAQPAQRQLVGGREHDEGVGGGVPLCDEIGMRQCVVERCVADLADLDSRRKIATGHQVEAGTGSLAVRHAVSIPERVVGRGDAPHVAGLTFVLWQAGPVTPAEPVDAPERRRTPRVCIVHLTAAVFRALADGDLAAANAASPVPLPPYFAGPEWAGVWRMRRGQVEQDPASAGWVTGAIWDVRQRVAVGRAGYHGPPDPVGMVEIGYAVDPAYRRRGYARAALEILLERAAREPLVRTVRVTIAPDNVASYRLVSQYGFAEAGEQWDDEDGLEIIYEVGADGLR